MAARCRGGDWREEEGIFGESKWTKAKRAKESSRENEVEGGDDKGREAQIKDKKAIENSGRLVMLFRVVVFFCSSSLKVQGGVGASIRQQHRFRRRRDRRRKSCVQWREKNKKRNQSQRAEERSERSESGAKSL